MKRSETGNCRRTRSDVFLTQHQTQARGAQVPPRIRRSWHLYFISARLFFFTYDNPERYSLSESFEGVVPIREKKWIVVTFCLRQKLLPWVNVSSFFLDFWCLLTEKTSAVVMCTLPPRSAKQSEVRDTQSSWCRKGLKAIDHVLESIFGWDRAWFTV